MKSGAKEIDISDYYFGFLENLSSQNKLDLISKLKASLKRNAHQTSLKSLFGAYKSEESAEEIIHELRASRNINRKADLL